MKGTQLGEFEELVLLTIGILDGEAYGINVADTIYEKTERKVTVSTIHTAMYRLEKKGFVESYYGGASAKRGGRKKRLYRITQYGVRVLAKAREQREQLWHLLPKFKFNYE
ncbi:PadR family transcriptional regulator [Fulvivirgaceae bacterium BMA12]|uniref:PadR family transcriptional regulator n=1 Tax=Agaribacillus aureus TaxID=3051825 RepID=A0ABT8LFQ6_9BACT|nr:PadR family transcriptional regulator [Fulvivirgaceae bacterium BMA12]